MTAANWTAAELDRIGQAEELEIAPQRRDGSIRRPLPIWVVRVGDDLFVRSWRGAGGGWYRAAEATHQADISAGGVDKHIALADAGEDVNDAVDDAYGTKDAPHRRDGSIRRPLPIWVVRVGDDLFVRSWRGAGGGWYRAAEATHQADISAGGVDKHIALADAGDDVNDAVDAAYRTKYGRHSP